MFTSIVSNVVGFIFLLETYLQVMMGSDVKFYFVFRTDAVFCPISIRIILVILGGCYREDIFVIFGDTPIAILRLFQYGNGFSVFIQVV